jgi:hypothetical protein
MTAAQLLGDQRYLFRDFPAETITIGTQTLPCLVPDDQEASDFIQGGEENQPRASVILERSTTFIPKEGSTASYRGQAWRVAGTKRDFATSPIRVDLIKVT